MAPPESETMALSGGICVNVGYPHRPPCKGYWQTSLEKARMSRSL